VGGTLRKWRASFHDKHASFLPIFPACFSTRCNKPATGTQFSCWAMATTTRTALNGALSTQCVTLSLSPCCVAWMTSPMSGLITARRHTGDSSTGGSTNNSYVEFFIDDICMGRNNVFVPTRGSRLWISLWPTGDAKYVS
jgi:hypothetical protein